MVTYRFGMLRLMLDTCKYDLILLAFVIVVHLVAIRLVFDCSVEFASDWQFIVLSSMVMGCCVSVNINFVNLQQGRVEAASRTCGSCSKDVWKLQQGRVDYAFRGHGKFCNFVFFLLLKTRDIDCLPGIPDWDEYMSAAKI